MQTFRVSVPTKYFIKAAVTVNLYDSVREVRAAYVDASGKPDDTRHAAWVEPSTESGVICTLHISRTRATLFNLTHEVIHAVFYWLMSKPERWTEIFCNQAVATEAEERACNLGGAILVGIVAELQKRGVLVLALP